MHISLPADESNQEVAHELQDDAYGLVIASDGNHRVWRDPFPGGQGDPLAGRDISCPPGIETCHPVTRRSQAPAGESILYSLR